MTFNKKIIFGMIGVVVIANISQGVWEYMLRPLINLSSEFVLNFISFGVESFKNKIYLEIARNLHEDVSIYILILVTALFMSLAIVTFISIFMHKYLIKFIKNKIISKDNLDSTF